MKAVVENRAVRRMGDASVTLLEPLANGGWLVGDRTGKVALLAQGDWCWSHQPPMPIRDVAKVYYARSFCSMASTGASALVSGPAVYGLDLRTGDAMWHRRLPFYWGFFPSRPVAVADALGYEFWVSYDDGKMEALTPDGHKILKWNDGCSPFQMFPVGDGSVIAGSSGYGVGLWDVHTRKRVWHEPRRERILAMANARAARSVALLSLEYLEVLELDSGLSYRHEWAGGLPALAVTSDARRLAAGAHGGLYLCAVGNGSPTFVEVNDGRVTSLAFGSSGDRLWYGTSTGAVGTVSIEDDA